MLKFGNDSCEICPRAVLIPQKGTQPTLWRYLL